MNFQNEANRIFCIDEAGNMIAEVVFPNRSANVVTIQHTFVDESLRGRGVAGQLMQAVADQLRSENKKAVAACSYAVKWFGENPDYADVNAEE